MEQCRRHFIIMILVQVYDNENLPCYFLLQNQHDDTKEIPPKDL